MKSILVSGNPNYGLAQKIQELMPESNFCSRSSGYDLSQHKDMERVADLSLQYDVYISCSCLSQFRQVQLLEVIYHRWLKHQHHGQIIVLGSTADTPVKGTHWIYPIEKKALRAYCRNLSMAALGSPQEAPSGIRVTYLSPGHLDTPKANAKHTNVKKLDCLYVAQLISWLIQQPPYINISELCLDPIQESHDTLSSF